MLKSKIQSFAEPVKKKIGIFADVWTRRLNFVLSQLISSRLALGIKSHEGEFGLAIAKFVKESFRSISIVRKVERLSSSSLGKTYITKILLENVPYHKRLPILKDIEKIKDFNGLDFVEGIKKVMEKHLSPQELRKADTILGNRLAHALVSKNVVFDVVDQKLYTVDEFSGEAIEKKLDLRKSNDVLELLSYGVLDKSKDLYSDYAEWKMLKIVEERELKGLKGKDLGTYVHYRLKEELAKDELFQYCFNYYLVNHYNNLEKSKMVMAGFGDLVITLAKIQRKLAAAAIRAISYLPFGQLAEVAASLGESIAEAGESLAESVKKTKEQKQTPIKAKPLTKSNILTDELDIYKLRHRWTPRQQTPYDV